MIKSAISFTFALLLHAVYAQDFRDQFYDELNGDDTVAQLTILQKWETEAPNDPELYPAYFNYYFMRSRTELVSIQPEGSDSLGITITDSLGNVVGYIGTEFYYDLPTLEKGIDWIDKGIALFPNRLDMRFGKIYVLGQIGDWESYTRAIIQVIQYSDKNNNEWTWTQNQEQEDGEGLMLSSIQDYQYEIWHANDNDLLTYMRQIAEEILQYYPDHAESYSNIGVTHMVEEEFKKAEKAFLKAEKINPEDVIVHNNLAQLYTRMKDYSKAIKYYKKMIKYGDDGDKAFAESEIEALENKE